MIKFRLHSHMVTLLSGMLILTALSFLFDSYLNNVSQEAMSNWLRTEEVAILEGNLLPSVVKNQKMLLSSEFLKGGVLLDLSKPHQLEQIVFGEPIETSKIQLADYSQNKTNIIRVGLFKRYAIAKIPNQESMVIVFSIWSEGLSKFFLFSCALFLGLFGFHALAISRLRKEEYNKRSKQAELYAEKAARVAHDIRSPMSLLSSVIDKMDIKSEQRKKLSQATDSLREITKDLIETRSAVSSMSAKTKKDLGIDNAISIDTMNLADELKLLIENKKDLHPTSNLIFVDKIEPIVSPIALDISELRRSISNILDNAIEASSNGEIIRLNSKTVDEFLEIEISDSGKGIPGHILPSIGTKGFTYGKTDGSGIGIFYTKLALENIGGSFKIVSQEGHGTQVILRIPLKKTRMLSSSMIQLEKGSSLVMLDNDPLIIASYKLTHQQKLMDQSIHTHFFLNTKDFLDANLDLKNIFLLSDLDLEEENDGLDFIASLGLQGNSMLVTGMHSDESIQNKARRLGNIPVFPKERLGEIRFTFA